MKIKELWVKKTIWRRYLVEESRIQESIEILKHDPRGEEIIGDCFDINEEIEYDDEEIICPVQFEHN